MISDRTIEEKTAKYWCAFANKEFKIALDQIIKEIVNKNNQDIAQSIIKNSTKNKTLNEGFLDFLSKLSPSDPTGGSIGIVSDLSGKTKEEIQANAAAMSSAAGIAAASMTPIGKSIVGKTIKTAIKNPITSGLTVATGKLAMDAVGEEGDNWYDKLGKLVNKIWDIGKFAKDHAKLLAVCSTTAYVLFKTADIWLPIISSTIKSLLRGNSLATVDFDSNGTWYRMRYDVKYKKWELSYKGFSFGSSPSPEEIEQIMNTRFFRRFLEKCKKYIEPLIDNENRKAIIDAIASLLDKKTKQAIENVFDNNEVLDNMFALKFKY